MPATFAIVPSKITQALCNSVFASPTECGFRNADGLGAALNNINQVTVSRANYAEFPWVVAILEHRRKSSSFNLPVYKSAGSLINPRIVLTTAYNIAGSKFEDMVIRAGLI